MERERVSRMTKLSSMANTRTRPSGHTPCGKHGLPSNAMALFTSDRGFQKVSAERALHRTATRELADRRQAKGLVQQGRNPCESPCCSPPPLPHPPHHTHTHTHTPSPSTPRSGLSTGGPFSLGLGCRVLVAAQPFAVSAATLMTTPADFYCGARAALACLLLCPPSVQTKCSGGGWRRSAAGPSTPGWPSGSGRRVQR